MRYTEKPSRSRLRCSPPPPGIGTTRRQGHGGDSCRKRLNVHCSFPSDVQDVPPRRRLIPPLKVTISAGNTSDMSLPPHPPLLQALQRRVIRAFVKRPPTKGSRAMISRRPYATWLRDMEQYRCSSSSQPARDTKEMLFPVEHEIWLGDKG